MLVRFLITCVLIISQISNCHTSGYLQPENITSDTVQILPNINSYEPELHSDSESSYIRGLIGRLEQYILNISTNRYDEKTITNIRKIYNIVKTEELYSVELPKLIQSSHQIISNENGVTNFINLMRLLNIKPLHITEFNTLKYTQLDAVTRLLILSSRSIIHSFAMTNLFDYDSEIDLTKYEVNTSEYPWLERPKHYNMNTQCILDSMKIIYEHCFDYLSQKQESRLPPLDSIYYLNRNENGYLLELMDEYGFIPWNRKVAQNITEMAFNDYIKCYSVGTNIIFSEIMEDVHLPYTFLETFDMVSEYARKVCDGCGSESD